MKTFLRTSTALLLSALSLIEFGCNPTSHIDSYIGSWASTNPADSIAPVFRFKKIGDHVLLNMKLGKQEKEVTATYDNDHNQITASGMTFFYLPDSGYIKCNVNGKSGDLKKIDDNQASAIEDRVIKKQKADSIKAANPFKDYKNNDVNIANDILKRVKPLKHH